LFDVYLLFICLLRCVLRELCENRLRPGGTPKNHRSLARNTPSQIHSEIPQITARVANVYDGSEGLDPRELFVEEKSQWADELHELIREKPCRDRPFVCDWLPELCDVVVIGENPGTEMKNDWWCFWDDTKGFDLGKFERAYIEARRLANRSRPIGPARLRLNRLRFNGLKCLETNVFRNEQLGGAGDGVSNEELLRTLIDHRHLPDLKAVIVHGVVAREEWRRLGLPLPTGVQSYFMDHFSRRVSYDDIDKVSQTIKRQTI
jgi:hypothetical protein